MQSAPVRSVFGEITDFLASLPSPEAIITYELPEDLQARAAELLEKNGESELSDREHEEMMDFVRIDNMLLLLKAKMKLNLRRMRE
jgi:hypothetical protein